MTVSELVDLLQKYYDGTDQIAWGIVRRSAYEKANGSVDDESWEWSTRENFLEPIEDALQWSVFHTNNKKGEWE